MIGNKLIGTNKSLAEQLDILERILLKNEKLKAVLTILSQSKLKNYYVAAGCINKTVFNYYHNNDLDFGIEDFDIVYYDEDLSYEKEDEKMKQEFTYGMVKNMVKILSLILVLKMQLVVGVLVLLALELD